MDLGLDDAMIGDNSSWRVLKQCTLVHILLHSVGKTVVTLYITYIASHSFISVSILDAPKTYEKGYLISVLNVAVPLQNMDFTT